MTQVVSKVGINSVGGNRTGYGPFLQRIAAADRRLSCVVCYDDYGAIDEPLSLWPDVLTIGGETAWDDAPYDVALAYNRIVALRERKPGLKYIKYLNERNGDYPQQADFYIALMDSLADTGIGLAMFDCASGTPFRPGEGNGEGDMAYSHISRACKHAKDNGLKVILNLHEYVSSGSTIGRYKVMADYLGAHDALIPIVISEWLFETFPDQSAFMTFIRALDPVYMADTRVLGCAAWTLGGGGWADSNYASALPDLGEYIATISLIDPPPPPPPDDGMTVCRVTIPDEYLLELRRWVARNGGTVVEWS